MEVYSPTGNVYSATAIAAHGGVPVDPKGRRPGQCCFGCGEYRDQFTRVVKRWRAVEPAAGQLAHMEEGGCLDFMK